MQIKYIHFGKCLKIAQAMRDVKNVDIAKEFGVKPQQVIRWRGMADMNMHKVQWFAQYFGMTVDEFMSLDNAGR